MMATSSKHLENAPISMTDPDKVGQPNRKSVFREFINKNKGLADTFDPAKLKKSETVHD